MRILLTGASGLVGSNVVAAAERRGHKVLGARIELSDPKSLTAAVLECFPDAIINAAAISEPERCEADPGGSRVINALAPGRLAELAHHLSCRLVHISSEQVFDGTRAPYSRDDPTAPMGAYGRQKVESEQLVDGAAPQFAATVRAPLLMGNSAGGRRSVHERLFLEWSQGRVARLFTDEIRQPCTAGNLADVLVELCERRDMNGVFHWAGADAVSRHELGVRIATHFGIEAGGRIEAGRVAGSPLEGIRPADLSLRLHPLAGALKTRVQSLDEGFESLTIPESARSWWGALAE